MKHRSREENGGGQGWEGGGNEEIVVKGNKVAVCRTNRSRNLMYSRMATVNTVLNIGNLLKE